MPRHMSLDVAPTSCLLRGTTRRASMANEVAVEARYRIEIRDLEYQRCGDEPMLARLYRPIGAGPFPALVDVHGGAWASGDRLNNAPLDEAHDAYWSSETEMAEGNPQSILERGEAEALPPAILVQGLADDNVTPDMAQRFAAAYRARGGRIELHEFTGQPHTFIIRDPASDASRRATELIRDFVLSRADAR